MERNKNLKSYNTFGFEIRASKYAEFHDEKDLEKIFSEIGEDKWYVLGGGSNTLFTSDFDGVVLHSVAKNIELTTEYDDHVSVRAEAGVVWDDFVEWTVSRGFYGLENLSYIPGSVGASPVQNIGAYGAEAKDFIESVEYFDTLDNELKIIGVGACRFGYRDSIFKQELKERAIVIAVNYRLSRSFTPNIRYGNISSQLDGERELTARYIREVVTLIRKTKLPEPEVIGNGGSFFKNPIVENHVFESIKENYPNMPYYQEPNGIKIPAGWLIDTAGWKGYKENGVGVHENQALVLVHFGGATGSEVVNLSNRIIADIEQKFGITLHPEINIL